MKSRIDLWKGKEQMMQYVHFRHKKDLNMCFTDYTKAFDNVK